MYDECPFLRPARSLSPMQPVRADGAVVGVYCALPGRRVRVPGIAEMKMFCMPDRFEDCPYYRRHVAAR